MSTQEFRFDANQILQPALPGAINRTAPMAFGANLTVGKGQSVGRKTSDSKAYPYNADATDGTQIWAGFNQQALTTDAAGLVYLTFSGTAAGSSVFSPASTCGTIYTGGIFYPSDVTTSPATGTPTAEVDTLTPTSPTTGDIYTIGLPDGAVASFTVGATQTATATVTGLAAAWNANPVLKALATTSGTATLILTGTTKGQALNLTAGVSGTGTTALVVTTPAVSAAQGEVDTFTPGGSIATGDIYSATITYPGGQTKVVTFTVGATTTAAAVSAGLVAAWNADATAANYATASGSTTFILTNTVPGNTQNVAVTSSGAGTITKVVTKPAFGQNIADVQTGNPGAHVLQPTGFWEIP